MATRPGLLGQEREQLVGLKPVGPVKEIVSGAHIFDPDDEVTRVNDQGYVTSSAYSPGLGHVIALAFLKGGRARIGETVRVVDHMKSSRTLCVVQEPVQLDPDGARTRG